MMDRHRGGENRFSGEQDSQFRTKPPPSRSPDGHRGGFSRGGGRRPYDSPPPRFSPTGRVGGFRPSGGGGGRFDNDHVISLSGNKRGFPFSSEQGRSPVHVDGSGAAKLFVGSVPRTATEEDIRPLFMEHGNVLEVAIIKDKKTGLQQGCCFVKYATSEEADRAIRGLHNQQTLPGGLGPIQVRYADGERERLGAVEFKLFVGSMNKYATEKEIEEVFAPYGRVDDVYLMRDEYKQSRGCGFVKFPSREMAMAAINGLSGVYTMQGCDKPLSVRFAEPKRPRPGETSNRGGPPTFGGPGFGPRFEQPGSRPPPNLGVSMSSNAWNPVSSQNAEGQGFGNQMFPRPAMPPNVAVPSSTNNGPTNGLRPGFGMSPSMPQQGFIQSTQQVNTTGQQQMPPFTRPVQSLTDLPSSGPMGSLSNPPSSSQIPANQVLPPQQFSSMQNFTPPYQAPANGNIQQQNQQMLPTQQTPSQLVQMLSQQKQSLQASLQSSQQAFTQIRQQYQQIQPSLQNMMPPQQTPQTNMQQSQWGGGVAQQTTVARTTQHNNLVAAAAAADDVPPTTAKSTPSTIPGTTAPSAKCSWTEHTSPDGFKYYHNIATQQSTWEKPEELTQFEQQQQKHSVQQPPQAQSYPQNMPTQQAQQVQFQQQYRPPEQFQQSSLPQQYQASGLRSQQNYQEFGYRQMPAGAGSVNALAQFQQGGGAGSVNAPAQFQQGGGAGSVNAPAQFQQGGQQTNQEILWKKNNSSGN